MKPDFSEYEPHIERTYADQRNRIWEAHLRGIFIGALCTSLLWFTLFIAFSVITR